MESAVKHSSSLGWFRDNEFEKKLVDCGYQVSTILLFLCNVEATDLKTYFPEAEGRPVFDYPLFDIIPSILDRKIAKSIANHVCRKLNVMIESVVYFDSHAAIENVTMEQLRSFCKRFGPKKFKKKEEGRSLAFGIYHSLKLNPSFYRLSNRFEPFRNITAYSIENKRLLVTFFILFYFSKHKTFK
jgi:hypothetical protein